jgi:hypothetical protein
VDRSNGSWRYYNHAVKKNIKDVILSDDEKYKIAMILPEIIIFH